jgi:hypothetical protein
MWKPSRRSFARIAQAAGTWAGSRLPVFFFPALTQLNRGVVLAHELNHLAAPLSNST